MDEIDNCSVKTKTFTLEQLENGIFDEEKTVDKTLTISDVTKFLTGDRFVPHNKKSQSSSSISVMEELQWVHVMIKSYFRLHKQVYRWKFVPQNKLEDIVNSPGFGQT